MQAALTIGRLARSAGVNVQTIRFYQRLGLIAKPPRPSGGARRYSSDMVVRIKFVKRAQALGFSLDEIAVLLGLSDGKHCAETKALTEKKLTMVEEKINDLVAIQNVLKALVAECSKGGRKSGCPIIDALAEDSD
ncbi:MAG: Hg(II)-responsive transcriptional regulator [Betaproteobacteria bacterium]|nr:Hg(II)-responsive transcriptional regulator [Betaproteobacteria bacterium]